MSIASIWVIGARGLLGSAVVREIDRTSRWTRFDAPPLPWNDEDGFATAAARTAASFLEAADGGPWAIVWAAGAAVTGSSESSLIRERAQLRSVLDAVGTAAVERDAAAAGAWFYASSAGGIYAGAEHPPYTERSIPDPLAPYGRFKLAAENDVRAFSTTYGVASLNGRISNLYGPGQRLDKMQGLISHLALAQVTPFPASIYVSLDTLRDYLYVDDAARLILDAIVRLRAESVQGVPLSFTKNLVSGSAVTIADLLGYFRQLTKGHPHVMLGESAVAALQARDLRIRSVIWPELDIRELTPFAAGIHATIEDIRLRVQQGGEKAR